jgi:hypothetical protein
MSFSSKEYYEENNCPVWHVDDDGLYLFIIIIISKSSSCHFHNMMMMMIGNNNNNNNNNNIGKNKSYQHSLHFQLCKCSPKSTCSTTLLLF